MKFRYAGSLWDDQAVEMLVAQAISNDQKAIPQFKGEGGAIGEALPREIPLEALEGTKEPEQIKREGLSGDPLGLGAPITAPPRPSYVTDIPIKAGYRNIYGTDVNATYNPTTGAVGAEATIPIGKAENGYRIGVEGSYNPGLMDSDGITPPDGYSGMIRFSRHNPVKPETFEEEGAEKFAIYGGFDMKPRRVPPQRSLPVDLQVSPGPGAMPPGALGPGVPSPVPAGIPGFR